MFLPVPYLDETFESRGGRIVVVIAGTNKGSFFCKRELVQVGVVAPK